MDTARGDDAWAVLTGDPLFVGDVARPDLAVEREECARDLFRSLNARLLTLPPETEVSPGRLGGSMCGGPGMDQKISSTIGFELGDNPILSEAGEDGVVARALAGLGPQPPRFGDIVALNRGSLVTEAVRAAPLSARQVDVVPEGIDPAGRVVICASGQRSGVGASLLKRAGVPDVIHVGDGGLGTVAQTGCPLRTA